MLLKVIGPSTILHVQVSQNGGLPKIIHFHGILHYRPSSWRSSHFIPHRKFSHPVFGSFAGPLQFRDLQALMKSSLLKLSQLPPTTRIFCGHEYTVPRHAAPAWGAPVSWPLLKLRDWIVTPMGYDSYDVYMYIYILYLYIYNDNISTWSYEL